MNNKTALLGVNEILGSFLSHLVHESDIPSLSSHPKSFLYEKTNLCLPDEVALKIVSNQDRLVHLTLPYYKGLEEHMIDVLNEDDLANISGGELVVGLKVAFGIILGVVGTISVAGIIGAVVADYENTAPSIKVQDENGETIK